MLKFTFAFLVLTLAALPAAAMAPTKDALTQPANPSSSNVGTPIDPASEPRLRSVAEADRLAAPDTRFAAQQNIGTLNGEEKNDRDYVLFWPDWESDLLTPTNFNK